MSLAKNRRVVLARHVAGEPRIEDFRIETVDVPGPADGQILVRNRFLSVDPGTRSRLSGQASYAPPLALGAVIDSANVGEVVASRHAKFATGDWVAAGFGWQEFALSDGRGIRKIDPRDPPPSTQIGVLGIPGLSAYFGMLDIGRPKEGETVLISSAAGPVGSAAGQIARLKGARVVGIAGGAEKCRWLTTELGFAAAIDRHTEHDLAAAIRRHCPKGIDVLFDNVGNALIDAVLPLMRPHGRIVVSGQVADYNREPGTRPGLTNTNLFIASRLTMRGFVAFDYVKEFPTAWREMTDWIGSGALRYREDIEAGIDRAPGAFIGLFKGENFGRKLIRLD